VATNAGTDAGGDRGHAGHGLRWAETQDEVVQRMTPAGEELQSFGDYRVIREIGRGGMGIVYRVEHVSSGRHYALKVLPEAKSADQKNVARFRREAEVARRLRHAHIIAIHHIGQEEGLHYFVMDLVEGRNLEEIILRLRRRSDSAAALLHSAQRRLSSSGLDRADDLDHRSPHYVDTVLRLASEVADALDHAHREGLIHRDVKPSNLLLDPEGRLVVTDFGLVRDLNTRTFTLSGEMVGTPLYMSPEQIAARPDEVDGRADVYSLGATLYEALTLAPPYASQELPSLMREIQFKSPVPPRRLNARIPREVEIIIGKAMAKRPADRYATMRELANDLNAALEGRRIRAQPVGPLGRAWRTVLLHRERSIAVGLSAAAILALGAFIIAGEIADHRRQRTEIQSLLEDAEGHLAARSYRSAARSCDALLKADPQSTAAPALRKRVEGSMLADLERAAGGPAVGLIEAWNTLGLLREIRADAPIVERATTALKAGCLRAADAAAAAGDAPLARAALARRRELDPAMSDLDLAAMERRLGDGLLITAAAELRDFRYSAALRCLDSARELGGSLPSAELTIDPKEMRRPGYALLEDLATRVRSPDERIATAAARELAAPQTLVRLPHAECQRLLAVLLEGARTGEPELRRRAIQTAGGARAFELTAELLAIAAAHPEDAAFIAEAFAEIRDPRAASWLKSELARARDPMLRQTLVVALAWCGDPAAATALLDVVRDESAGKLRILAAWGLGKLGADAAAADLLALAKAADPAGARQVVRALVEMRAIVPLDAIRDLFARSGDTDLEVECVRLAARDATSESQEFLVSVLRSSDEERLRVETARALAHPRWARAANEIAAVLARQSEPPKVRALCAFALGEARTADGRAALLAHVANGPVMVRQAAALALERFAGDVADEGARKILPALLAAYREDGSDDVRAAAAHALARQNLPVVSRFFVDAVRAFTPDSAGDVVRALFGESREGAGTVAELFETYGALGVLLPGASVFLVGENNVVAASCEALGYLASAAKWTDKASRGAAAEALATVLGMDNAPSGLRRTALEALACFGADADPRVFARFLVEGTDPDLAGGAAIALGRLGRAADALPWFESLAAPRAVDCFRHAVVLALGSRSGDAILALRHAALLGFADTEAIAQEPALAPLAQDPRFEAVDRQMRVR
jgi:serine/threonine protein kinase